jgi:hypothetical protein
MVERLTMFVGYVGSLDCADSSEIAELISTVSYPHSQPKILDQGPERSARDQRYQRRQKGLLCERHAPLYRRRHR